MQNQTVGGSYIILNNNNNNNSQQQNTPLTALTTTKSMSPAINSNEMLNNEINSLEASLISLLDPMQQSQSQQQQQQPNGYSTINSLLNGSIVQQQPPQQHQLQYKNVLTQATINNTNNQIQLTSSSSSSPSTTSSPNKKFINQIITTASPAHNNSNNIIKKPQIITAQNIVPQPQSQQAAQIGQPYINLNYGQIQNGTTPPTQTPTNAIKLINTSPNNATPQQRIIIQATPQHQHQQQQQQQQQQVMYTSSSTTASNTQQQPQIQIVSTAPGPQQQQQQQPTIAFLNINNRMVPLQTLNLQPKPHQQHVQTITTASNSNNQQNSTSPHVKFVIPSSNDQPQQSQQQFVINNDSGNRIILTTANGQQIKTQSIHQQPQQQQQQTYYVVQSSQIQQHLANSNQQQQLPQKVNVVLSGHGNGDLTTTTVQQSQIDNDQQQQQQQSSSNNLGAQITDKMKTLEQIQNQLRVFQLKISNELTNLKRDLTNLTQQQQIQLVLNHTEQLQLQKLIQRRKEVQNEIQQLQQKLLAPSTTDPSPPPPPPQQQQQPQPSNPNVNHVIIANNSNKQEVYQNIVNNINSLKAKNDLTLDELEKLKKLIEFKHTFETKFNLQPIATAITTTVNGVQNENLTGSTSTSSSLPIINIKVQNPNILQNATAHTLNQNKIITISNSPQQTTAIVAPSTVVTPTSGGVGHYQSNKSKSAVYNQKSFGSSIKIRNVPICTIGPSSSTSASSSASTVYNQNSGQTSIITPVIALAPNSIKTKPIRTLIASKDFLNASVSSSSSPSSNSANSMFRLLNYDLLVANGVISKSSLASDPTIKLIKQLDEKVISLNNPEKQQALLKNQVQIVKKYLEQFTPNKTAQTIKNNKMHEQLLKDQELALKPDYMTPFADRDDAFRRLSAYHVFQRGSYEPTEEECTKFDDCFEKVAQRYLKAADAMINRFHVLQLRNMQRSVPTTDESLILKLYMDDARLDFEEEKKQKTANPDDIDTIKCKLKRIERCLSYEESNTADTATMNDLGPAQFESIARPSFLSRFKYEVENGVVEDGGEEVATGSRVKLEKRNINEMLNDEVDDGDCGNKRKHIKLKLKLIKNEADDFINVNNPTETTTTTSKQSYQILNREISFNSHQSFLKDDLFDTSDCNINDESSFHSHELDTSSYSINEQQQHRQSSHGDYGNFTSNYDDDGGGIDETTLNNLSCLDDDFIMNEDVQSILDY